MINGFIDRYMLLHSQYGFVAGMGTQPLLEDFTDLIYGAFKNNIFACALFLNIAKAFDTVSHELPLRKMYRFGFRADHFLLSLKKNV